MADVKDQKFIIGNATVMIAPYSEDAFALNPTTHSVGMVKAVTMTQESDQIMLKNGVAQLTVDTTRSNVSMSTSFEGYEFSARNIMYALGLDGTVTQRLRGRLTADAASAATSLSVESYPLPGEPDSLIDATTDIPNGAQLLVQRASEPDFVYPVKATADATGAGPYDVTIAALPTDVSFSTGDTVWVVNEIDAGSFSQDDFFCAKIVGKLSANDEPIVVIIPKMKITRGFNLSFSETDYSNLPFEVEPIVMTATEVAGRPELAGFEKTLARAYLGG